MTLQTHLSDVRDRARAAFLGLAVGGALGATVEFMTPAEIRARHGMHRDITGCGWLRGPQQAELLWEPSEIRGEVAALGLSVQRADHVLRPVETTDGVTDAIDTLLLAKRQAV